MTRDQESPKSRPQGKVFVRWAIDTSRSFRYKVPHPMGLDINTVLFLIDARKRGITLGEMLTLGRQQINVYPRKMEQVLKKHGLPADSYLKEADSPFAEPCL